MGWFDWFMTTDNAAKMAANARQEAAAAATARAMNRIDSIDAANAEKLKEMRLQNENRIKLEQEKTNAYIKQMEAQGKDAKEAMKQANRNHQAQLEIFQQALKKNEKDYADKIKREQEEYIRQFEAQRNDAKETREETYRLHKDQVKMYEQALERNKQDREADIAQADKRLQQLFLESKEARQEQHAMFEKTITTFNEQFKEMLLLIRESPSKPAPMPGKTPEEMEKLRKEAQNTLGIDSVRHYNFGFTGNSGVGKSSFVNSMRGLKAKDPGAADVGEVECTDNIREYIFPQLNHIRLWDIPGAGTQDNPSESYFMDKKLYALDGLVIIFSDRFFQVDAKIAKSALENNVPYIFVRSKADQAIDSKIEERQMSVDNAKNELRQQIKEITARELKKAEMFAKEVYCCSTRGFVGTDEQKDKYGMDEKEAYEAIAKAALARRS